MRALLVHVGHAGRAEVRWSAYASDGRQQLVVGNVEMNWLNSAGVFAHEVAHALGLRDRYTDVTIDGRISSVPHPGYRQNLMGSSNQTGLHAGQLEIMRANLAGGWDMDLRGWDIAWP